jgi:hypothetical protein
MKIVAYGVGNWDNQVQAEHLKIYYEEWRNRVRAYCNEPEMFIATGTYSDPKFTPLNLPVIQNGVTKTRPYTKEWNYFRNGFITGCWHALLNLEFDVLIHVQCRTLLGVDLMGNLHRFMDSSKQIMAPRFVCIPKNIHNSVEVGLMAMKPDAVRLYTSFGLRPSISPFDQINCETEALELFSDSWYNPYPEVHTCRKRVNSFGKDSEDDLSKEEFMKLPFIAAHKHAKKEDVEDWCHAHPCKIKGGIL